MSRAWVDGTAGGRRVDFPTLPNGNLNAPTIMVAERASDLLQGKALPLVKRPYGSTRIGRRGSEKAGAPPSHDRRAHPCAGAHLPGNRGPRPSPRWGSLYGPQPVGTATLIAILFTSGLDVGLILFPLLDFDRYATGAAYQFANPLAIEFGFWGFWVWGLYFLSAAYFCLFEPRLKLFEHPWVKTLHNGIILGTCAFTAYLFCSWFRTISRPKPPRTLALVAVVVLLAVASSLRFQVLRWLSVGSSLIFLALVLRGAVVADLRARPPRPGPGPRGLLPNFPASCPPERLPRVLSVLVVHLGLMIGQFIARFLAEARSRCWLLLVVPSSPSRSGLRCSTSFTWRPRPYRSVRPADGGRGHPLSRQLPRLPHPALYAEPCPVPGKARGLGLPCGELGLIFGLVLLFRYTPLKIEWLGLAVLGLYGVIGFQMLKHRVEAVT